MLPLLLLLLPWLLLLSLLLPIGAAAVAAVAAAEGAAAHTLLLLLLLCCWIFQHRCTFGRLARNASTKTETYTHIDARMSTDKCVSCMTSTM